jgi:hypothetical protein
VRRVLEGHSGRLQMVMSALSSQEQRELHALMARLGEHLKAVAEREEMESRG